MQQASHRRHALLNHTHEIADIETLAAVIAALQAEIDALELVVAGLTSGYPNELGYAGII